MPARPLALAALLLLAPVPAVAQPVAETGPATTLESPAEAPATDGPGTGAPEGAEVVPADTAAPESPAAEDDATLAPDGPSAPATAPDARSVTGTGPSEAGAGGTTQPPAQTTGPAGAELVGPTPSATPGALVTDDSEGAGVLPESTTPATPVDEGSQVAPGTVDRISLGALTRVPAQDSSVLSALSPAAWGLVVSALAAVAATALLLHRWRARRSDR